MISYMVRFFFQVKAHRANPTTRYSEVALLGVEVLSDVLLAVQVVEVVGV